MSDIANLIRRVRERSGQTQAEAAEEIGTTETTFARWERGENQPQPGLFASALLDWIKEHSKTKAKGD